jgi:glycosyltransferase involved in cell wall biosynthesis
MLISTASSIGGMERVVCSLARGLADGGAAVRTFFPHSADEDRLLRWCAEQGVSAETHSAVLDAAAPHSAASAAALRTLIADLDPDVVNIHYGDNFLSMYDILGARAAGLRRTLVASVHHPTAWTSASRRKRWMTLLGSRAANAVTTFSSATYEVLRAARVPDRRLHIIPCGVRVPDQPPSRVDARRELAVDEGGFIVATLARLVEYKGVDKLVEAMDCAELAGATLLVAGDGPMRRALEVQAERSEYVDARFLGRVPYVDALFASCDVFALPSRLEGFGLVYVEAAMYGVPSIATRVGGVPDAVQDGRTGVLIAPDDVGGLREALIRMRTDPDLRTRLGAAARHRAMTELNEDTMVRRFSDLFARLQSR